MGEVAVEEKNKKPTFEDAKKNGYGLSETRWLYFRHIVHDKTK